MLARQMGRTVSELGASMTASEFLDHWDDYRREPWGVWRDAHENALTRQTIVNMSGKSLADGVEVSRDECLLKWKDPNAPPSKPDLPPELAHLKKFIK